MARGYIYNKGRSNCNPLQQSCDWAWGLLVCLFLTFTVVPQPLIKCEQKGLLKNPCITCRLKRANLKCINPASRGLPGSRYKPERHPEPLLLGRPGPALEGGLPFRRAAQPRPALRCGPVQRGRTPSAYPRHSPSINAAEDPISVLGSGARC